MNTADIFNRVNRLVGSDALLNISNAKIIVFGIGGVGSWTVEALVRSGVGHITIVDADTVATSNINRQLPATTLTVGQLKVEVMRKRMLEINPEVDIKAIAMRYTAETADDFVLTDYDYVVDAIDSLADKALLIHKATSQKVRLLSSMGAALKMDPTRIRVAEFRNVIGCRLAAALRRKFKQIGLYPARKFRCVYSDELLPNRGEDTDNSGAMTYGKIAVNGALCHVTAIFGLMLAGLIIEELAAGK